jgi:tripartite-type tricarboxylate transporter receptor subunit TctC
MRQLIARLCAVAIGLAAASALAFPEKSVTLVVSDQAGGPGDIVARALAEHMSGSLKQTVLVENRPGAYGTLGLRAVAQARPDGHTLGIVFMPHTVSQTLFKGTPYRLRSDFTPLAKVADLFNVLIVRNDLPVRSAQELAALARQRAGGLNYGSASPGSPAHLSAELFKRQAGVDALHVPFRGPVDALSNLIGGRVDFMFLSLPVAMPMVKADKVRALAVTSPRAAVALPVLPTMQGSGFPDFVVLDWMGVVGPAGLPPAVAQTLGDTLRQAAGSPAFRDKLATLGMEPGFAPGPELGALIDSEVGKWERFIRDVGITLE